MPKRLGEAMTALVSLFLVSMPSAHAQAALSGSLEEQFAGPVNVSGVLLVGLSTGSSAAGTVNPERVLIRLPTQGNAGMVCFNATTRDGQYWARGRLAAPAGPSTIYQVSKTWRFREQLTQYSQEDVAFRARLSTNCEQAQNAPLVPVIVENDTDTLIAQINAGNALSVSAQLKSSGATLTARCTQSRARRSTAFTHSCSFSAARTRGWSSAELVVTRLLESGVNRSQSFSIVLPAGP